MGGGACLDVVGFAASVYRRGVPYLRIPTTLMAQIDAGIGAKTAINWGARKNRVGAFAPPAYVLIDYDLLETLPPRHVANGVAEIIKMGVCSAPGLFTALERHMDRLWRPGWDNAEAVRIYRWAVQAMLAQLSPNLFETDLERLVDFGHWLSPHLELQQGDILHGEAVAMDMAVSCAVAAGRGLLQVADLERVLGLIERAGLPLLAEDCSASLVAKALEETRRHRGGLQRIPLPVRPGECLFVNDVGVDEVLAACQMLADRVTRRPTPGLAS
jgi:3-dehydroquinate synthase